MRIPLKCGRCSDVAVYTAAFLLWSVVGQAKETPVATLHADQLFESDRVMDVSIRLIDHDWQSLRNQYRDTRAAFENPLDKPYSYFKGDITIDGVTIRDVGIRKKGFIGSQDTFRPSLKVKFSEYVDQQPVEGLDRLTLNNNKQDRALVSQYLTYRLFRKAGIYAPRCSFAAVTVNGEYLGVYSHVESIKKPFLKNGFSDDSGLLYEGTLADFYPKAIDRFEAKTSASDKDRSRLLELAELLNSEDRVDLTKLSKIVDVDYFLRFWAIESLIGFWDGYTQNQNNYLVYDSPVHAKMFFIPWGADSCFSDRRPRFARFAENASIAVCARSMLAHGLYHADGIPERYRVALEEILNDHWNEDDMLREIDRIEKLVFDHLDFPQISSILALDDVRTFIRDRRDTIVADLASNWPAVIDAQPRKPMYTVQVGSVTGRFSTQWNADDLESSQATVAATMEEEELAFESIHVEAQPADRTHRIGSRPIPSSSALLTFTATQPDTSSVRFNLVVPMAFFRSNEKPSQVSGSFAGREVEGTIQFERAGVESGDPVVGTFEIKIMETRGGRWGRR